MPTKYTRKIIFPIGPSIAYVPLTRGLYSLIDSCYAERVGEHSWHAAWSPQTKKFYAKRTVHNASGGKLHVAMHRFILGDSAGEMVDHRDGNTLDNRRSQLRSADRFRNQYNAPIRVDNTSGLKGVSRNRETGKWQAQIRHNGVRQHLGWFPTAESAHAVYSLKAAELHGEFVRGQ